MRSTAWILSIGTELTLGQTVDTNAAWLAARLAGLGVRAVRHLTIADDLADTATTLRDAARNADWVLVTGGLGPTEDDFTRAALAEAAGVALVQDAGSVERLRAFFAQRGREMPPQNLVQAQIPQGARAIPNETGTAPGVRLELERSVIFSLPGVPFEMMRMFVDTVAPEIASAVSGRIVLSRKLNTCDVPESIINDRIRDLMRRDRNPEVGTTAAAGQVGVRMNATGATSAEAQALLDDCEAEVRRRLGDAIFGVDDDTLAQAVGRLLVERGETVATAESCTGGLISTLLTDVPGSSAYFRGGVVAYANTAKVELLDVPAAMIAQHGAVSVAVADAMAQGARRRLGSDWAISDTGVAGPTGGTTEKPVGLVCLGVVGPAGVDPWTEARRFGEDQPRPIVRLRAAGAVLNRLRLMLLEHGRR